MRVVPGSRPGRWAGQRSQLREPHKNSQLALGRYLMSKHTLTGRGSVLRLAARVALLLRDVALGSVLLLQSKTQRQQRRPNWLSEQRSRACAGCSEQALANLRVSLLHGRRAVLHLCGSEQQEQSENKLADSERGLVAICGFRHRHKQCTTARMHVPGRPGPAPSRKHSQIDGSARCPVKPSLT